jgi:hypothetical protein
MDKATDAERRICALPMRTARYASCLPSRKKWGWVSSFKHKVENLSDRTYHAVYVGVKGKLAASNAEQGLATAVDEEIKKIVVEYLPEA